MFKNITGALITVFAIVAANAAEQPRQFSCAGMMHEPAGLSPASKTARLTLSSPKIVAIDIDGSHIDASVESDLSLIHI